MNIKPVRHALLNFLRFVFWYKCSVLFSFPAAKSTENLSKDPGMDDDLEAGFRTPLSPTPLVPRGPTRGRMSPGSEMLTLEQFLKEANRESAQHDHLPKDYSPKDLVGYIILGLATYIM